MASTKKKISDLSDFRRLGQTYRILVHAVRGHSPVGREEVDPAAAADRRYIIVTLLVATVAVMIATVALVTAISMMYMFLSIFSSVFD